MSALLFLAMCSKVWGVFFSLLVSIFVCFSLLLHLVRMGICHVLKCSPNSGLLSQFCHAWNARLRFCIMPYKIPSNRITEHLAWSTGFTFSNDRADLERWRCESSVHVSTSKQTHSMLGGQQQVKYIGGEQKILTIVCTHLRGYSHSGSQCWCHVRWCGRGALVASRGGSSRSEPSWSLQRDLACES